MLQEVAKLGEGRTSLVVRTSFPPYNHPTGAAAAQWSTTATTLKVLNYAPRTFGLALENALSHLLLNTSVAQFLNTVVKAPVRFSVTFNAFVARKLHEEGEASLIAMNREGLPQSVVDVLRQWRDQFLGVAVSATTSAFPTAQAWCAWVTALQIFPPDWADHLEYERFLKMLGADAACIERWCSAGPQRSSLAHKHLRWFIKALTAVGLGTSLADVVAAVLAVRGCPADAVLSERELVALVEDTATRLETMAAVRRQGSAVADTEQAKAASSVFSWVPQVVIMDCEKDDWGALGFLQCLRYCLGESSAAAVIVQLPPGVDTLADQLRRSGRFTVVVDPEAHNAPALREQLGLAPSP